MCQATTVTLMHRLKARVIEELVDPTQIEGGGANATSFLHDMAILLKSDGTNDSLSRAIVTALKSW